MIINKIIIKNAGGPSVGDHSKKKYVSAIFMRNPSRPYLIPEYHNCTVLVSKIYKKVNPLSTYTSFKFLAFKLILFEILHLQNFIPCFSKGHNFTREIIRKKYASTIFP